MSAPIDESSSDEAVEALRSDIESVLEAEFGYEAGHDMLADFAARVRAEAVAGDRQRIIDALSEGVSLARKLRLNWVISFARVVEIVAAGSVPVAAPAEQRIADAETLRDIAPADDMVGDTLCEIADRLEGSAGSVPVATSADVDSQSLAEVGDRVPVMAVFTVAGRWVACTVTDAGVTGGFRTWQGVPEDADLRRSEVHSIWSDVPPWSPAIGLLRFPDELADGA